MIRQCMNARMPAVRVVVLFAAALLVTACIPFGQQFQSPEVTLETLRILRIVDAKADLTIGLRVYNPNTFALPVDRVECDVLIDSRPAATSRSAHVDPLPPMGEAKVELSGRGDNPAGPPALISIRSQVPVHYVV